MGFSKSSAKGKVHSNTSLPQETREILNNNLTLHLNQLEKKTTTTKQTQSLFLEGKKL